MRFCRIFRWFSNYSINLQTETGHSHSMVNEWFCLYIGAFWYKISQYFAPIIHIILFYQPFGVQKLVTDFAVWISSFSVAFSLYPLSHYELIHTNGISTPSPWGVGLTHPR